MANPSCSLNENLSANNVFRIVTTYQSESSYAHLPKDYPLQCQLRSIRYIDELLKFVEDDHFKKSLKLEPPNGEQSPQKFIPGHKKQSSWGSKYVNTVYNFRKRFDNILKMYYNLSQTQVCEPCC